MATILEHLIPKDFKKKLGGNSGCLFQSFLEPAKGRL